MLKIQNEIEQMNEICKPLIKLGISHFNFVRYYQDGSCITLSNQPACSQPIYKSHSPKTTLLKRVPDFEGTLLWSNLNKHPLFYEAAEFGEVENGSLIVLKLDDVTERYFFGTTDNDKANENYLCHQDLLKRFILYFKENAKLLIKQAEKTKNSPPSLNRIKSEENIIISQRKINEFLAQTKFNKICIRANKQDIYINHNEAKILALMKSGYTAKEISLAVGLTRKTVEIYRDKLKVKFELYSRSSLLSIAHANTWLSLHLLESPIVLFPISNFIS